MPPPQPLGRSLVPLAGESLPGFLLRLSFRLNLAPAELATAAGLTAARNAGSLHAVTLTAVPEAARRAFTHMTRLTDSQVTGLSLAAWRERYPLPAWMPRRVPRLPADVWSLFAPATRYCPECLAGDGSPVQESFGGPWLKTWHLPVVFACPAHRRLLEHRCPGCGQDVHAGRASNTLLPVMQLAGLHPAQCRTAPARRGGGTRRTLPGCCGARLDQSGPRQHASSGLLALQDKILGLLDPDGPASTPSAGLPSPPGRYFADLRALSLLAYTTWPAARDLSPSEEAAAATDQHVASLRQQKAEQRPVSPAPGNNYAPPPPLDTAVSAGLAHIADRILAGSTGEARAQLRLLLPPATRDAGRTNWARWVTLSAVPCSEGLQAAYDPLLRTFTAPFGQPRRASTAPGAARWGPENVPALIPEDWYQRHFTPIASISPVLARRTAALRLVQMTAGGALAEAAHYLGISDGDGSRATEGRIYSSAGTVHSGARQQTDPSGFEAGLRSLARELSDPGTSLVNYQRRRQALENWAIDEPTWNGLAARLPPRSRARTPDLGDRRRQVASVYVWVRVTSGEPGFAPRPIEATQPPDIGERWRRSWNFTWWTLLTRDNPHSGYRHLRAELDALTAALAKTIDPSHPADSTLGTVPLYVSRYPRRPRKPRTLTAVTG
jgi:hypothetical protein